MIKKEIRIIGIDDSPFDKKKKGKKVLVIGTIFRGGHFLDGLVSCYVKTDGSDSTSKIIHMINNCKFKPQLQCIFLNGIAVAGFNVIDVKQLSEKTKLPVIIVIRDFPDYKKIFDALKKIGQKEKIELITSVEKPVKMNKIYIQPINITPEKAKELLKITCTHSYIPEPLRAAHIIAAGIIKGESRGKA